MKKYILPFFILVICMCVGCERASVKSKLAHHAMAKVAKTLNQRYQLKFIGFSERAESNLYREIGLRLQISRVLSKEEGRAILIDSVKELLYELNGNPDLQEYLEPFPFTPDNVNIAIFVQLADGKTVYYPNILIFSLQDGKIEYDTKIPEKEFGYYTEEKETWEEALQIVRSQK